MSNTNSFFIPSLASVPHTTRHTHPLVCVARPDDATIPNPLSAALRAAVSLFRPTDRNDHAQTQVELSNTINDIDDEIVQNEEHQIMYTFPDDDDDDDDEQEEEEDGLLDELTGNYINDDDDGVDARLAARRNQTSSPTLKRRRSSAFQFLRRRPPSSPPPKMDFNIHSKTFGGIPQQRVYYFLLEAQQNKPPNTELATLLPYELQRVVFDELCDTKNNQKVINHKNQSSPSSLDINLEQTQNDKNNQKEQSNAGGLLQFPLRVVGDLIRTVTLSRNNPGDRKREKSATAVVSAAAMAHDTGFAPEVNLDGNSAAAAFAAASAIATSASLASLDAAELAGLKASVTAARAINDIEDANVFMDTVGVVPLITAARLLPSAEKAAALTALANLAIILPKSRGAMLRADDGSIIRTLADIVTHSGGTPVSQAVGATSAMWHTEALVSGTHLLGSLALARGSVGNEWRKMMALNVELIKGLQRLAGGMKNGEPEGAARAARRAMGALGINTWKPKVPGQRGLRILCIDGGGTRAIMAFEQLKQIKKSTGCEIHELFDIIGGTSTGAIVAASIGIAHKTVEEVELLYRDMIGKIFAKHPVNGPKMLITRSYYDTSVLESTLQQECGKGVFIDSLAEENMNRVFVVSSIMSRDPKQLHVFRNYTYPIGHESRYEGCVEAQLWEGLRASSAAPTFFSEIRVNGELHADGAIVANNPTAVALHETKCMYPGVPIELLVSLGNGVFEDSNGPPSEEEVEEKNMGWGDVVGSILASATSTETVHHAIQDLFPKDKYFRFNPVTNSTQIDETKAETLASFVKEANDYIHENQHDFDKVARILRPKTPRSLWRRFRDALQKEMQELESSSGNDDLYLPN